MYAFIVLSLDQRLWLCVIRQSDGKLTPGKTPFGSALVDELGWKKISCERSSEDSCYLPFVIHCNPF